MTRRVRKLRKLLRKIVSNGCPHCGSLLALSQTFDTDGRIVAVACNHCQMFWDAR